MMWLLTILVGAILFRVPRGTGLNTGIPKDQELVWAIGLSAMLCLALGSWWPMLSIPLLIAGEAPSWGEFMPSDPSGGDKRKLNLRGLLLLNPVMGEIHFTAYRFDDRLPRWWVFDGWQAYGEAVCGAVTATAYLVAWHFILLAAG